MTLETLNVPHATQAIKVAIASFSAIASTSAIANRRILAQGTNSIRGFVGGLLPGSGLSREFRSGTLAWSRECDRYGVFLKPPNVDMTEELYYVLLRIDRKPGCILCPRQLTRIPQSGMTSDCMSDRISDMFPK